VGNCYSSRPAEERVDGLNKPGAQSGDHFAMAASSTFGPPKSPDGMKVDRIKPDVVAPGINILSTCSGAREKVKDGDAAGLEKRAKGKYVDERYYHSNGTSMATPLVAGCVAVLRQALVEMSGVKEPSAALLKALIVNGAVPLEKIRACLRIWMIRQRKRWSAFKRG
jgi:serine protease AprX